VRVRRHHPLVTPITFARFVYFVISHELALVAPPRACGLFATASPARLIQVAPSRRRKEGDVRPLVKLGGDPTVGYFENVAFVVVIFSTAVFVAMTCVFRTNLSDVQALLRDNTAGHVQHALSVAFFVDYI